MRHDRPASEGAPVSKAAPADDRVASLERELAQAKLEKSAALGQLRRTQGDVQDWPPDVRPALRPDAFERFVRDRLAAVPDAELVDMDCDEYPCVAILRSHSKADDWEDQLVTVHDGLSDAGFGDDLHIVGLGSHAESDDHDVRLYAFGVAPADASDDVHTRLKFRASSDLEDLTAELAGSSAR